MTMTGRFGSKSGVTLVELLVVMLIVVILAVTMMPFLRDYIVRARYVAEAVPVVGDLRTKIELHRYEPGQLPGMKDQDATSVDLLTSYVQGASASSYIQTWVENTASGAPTAQFDQGIGVWTAPSLEPQALHDTEARHIGRDLNIESQHLTGRRLRPDHVFYTGRHAISTNAPSYAYCVGVFGNGKGLNAGSGYAVLEVYNANTNVNMKLVAEWRRFTERGAQGSQIPMVSANEKTATYTAAGGRAEYDAGVCHMGDLDALTSANATAVSNQLVFLEAAGWEFTKK